MAWALSFLPVAVRRANMRYFATIDNLSTVVLCERNTLMDFMDFGTPVHCRGCEKPVWGWIETEHPIAPGLPSYFGLVPAVR